MIIYYKKINKLKIKLNKEQMKNNKRKFNYKMR